LNSSQQINVYSPKKTLKGANLYFRNSILVAELDASISGRAVDDNFCESALQLLNEFRPAAASINLQSLPPLPDSLTTNSIAGVVNYLALTLQRWCGLPLVFAKVLHTPEKNSENNPDGNLGEHIVFECRFDHMAIAAGQVAAEMCLHCINANMIESERLEQITNEFLRVFLENRATQIPYIRFAEQQGIPWQPLTADGAILVFGQGAKLRKIHQNFTSSTSHIAARIATDKNITASALRAQGIPVPRQYVVNSAENALQAAQQLGFPVVVKPSAKDFGIAVSVDVRDEQELSLAFSEAAQYGPVIVEQLIPGDQHWLMVINGKFRSARKQKPAHVIGDGVQTVAALIDNTNEHRSANGWQVISNDGEAAALLKRQNMDMQSVPAEDQEVRLRTQANLSVGGTVEDVSAQIHPVNVQLAERAVAIIDIDVAGLDFITTDISKPYWEAGGAFCEVDVTPDLTLNEEEIILSEWFPGEEKGRVVLIVLLDTPTESNRGLKISEQLQTKISKVCLATKAGLRLDGELVSPGNFASHSGLRAALCEPGVNAVVLEIGSDELVKNGLGTDSCDLAIFSSQEGSEVTQFAEASRQLLESVSECVLDNSIVREGNGASSEAKQLAREINSLPR
jgi:cyanophycin synthetase